MNSIEKLEMKIKSTMNGIFRRLCLRIKPDVSLEYIKDEKRLIVHVKISVEKLLLIKMGAIDKNKIGKEFFDKIAKPINNVRNFKLSCIEIKYESKD